MEKPYIYIYIYILFLKKCNNNRLRSKITSVSLILDF